VPGLLEVVTVETAGPAGRHQGLLPGALAVRSWRGAAADGAPAGVAWRPLDTWVPYQRGSFVTPAFPGFISGHSTFSRAAAEVLTELTGSAYFPGGLGQFLAPANRFLGFEVGPSVDVVLQWATYFDAADQAGQSRLWGGIHLEPDDLQGRRVGSAVGQAAVEKARRFIEGR
jgi:hypothetical protein